MKRPVSVRALRQRMVLETPVETVDDLGGYARTWQTAGEVWSRIDTIADSAQFTAQQAEMVLTHRITLRWRADITGAMRLRWGARIFEILTAADADAQRRFMVCRCRELAP